MPIFTDQFGGATIYPSEVTYRWVDLTASVVLDWPTEDSGSEDVVARLMDVSPSVVGLSITMPNAKSGSNGDTVLFTNMGAFSYAVKNSEGSDLMTVGPGQAWQLYLKDNSTSAGAWGTFQYGAFISQANAAALAGTGLASSGNQLVPNLPVFKFGGNYIASDSSRGQAFVFTGTAATFTLPDPVAVGDGWFAQIQNSGTGSLTIFPGGSSTINGFSSKVLDVEDSCIIVTDGLNFFVIAFGQSATFAFDTVSIDVSGGGDYILAGNQLNRISYNFTGVLTANRSIIVPATVQQYWIRNNTTGAFTLTVKVAGQPGTGVTQGGANILFCDGIDVRSANTGGIATPIAVAQGGTGATNPTAARSNLGAGATGDALFTSATPAAAYAVLGRPPAGVVDGGTF